MSTFRRRLDESPDLELLVDEPRSIATPPEQPSLLQRLGRGFEAAAPALEGIPGFEGLTRIREAQQVKRQEDRQAANDFLKFHEQLAKIPPGPGKNYLIDQLGAFAAQRLGQALPKGYLAMLKKQNEEQSANFQRVLDTTVKKYNLGLTEGLLPLLTQRPDLLVDVVSKELDFQRRTAITEREKRDEALRARLLGVLEGRPETGAGAPPSTGIPGGVDATGIAEGATLSPDEAAQAVSRLRERFTPQGVPRAPQPGAPGPSGGDPTGLREGQIISPTQAQALAGTLQERFGASPRLADATATEAQRRQQALQVPATGRTPLTGPTVEVLETRQGQSLAKAKAGEDLRARLDQRIAVLDNVLRRGLTGLSPSETNEKFRTNLEQELNRLQKQRDRLDDEATKAEERAFRREDIAERRRTAAEERAFRQEEALLRRQEREEERPFKGIDTDTRTILRASGIRNPTPDDISKALDEKRNVQAHITAQNQRAAAEVQAERVDPVQSRQLGSLSTLLGHVKSLEQFTPSELRDWTGPIEGRLERLEQLSKKDPRYQAFLSTLARTRAALLFSRTDGGGGALTPTEFKVLEDFNVSNVSLDGALGFATNLKQIRRDLEGKIKAGAAFTGVQRGQVFDKAKQISDDIASQSTTDIGAVTETFGAPSAASKARRQKLLGMNPKQITEMSDAEFDALTPDDLRGLSTAQYGALKNRARQREGR